MLFGHFLGQLCKCQQPHSIKGKSKGLLVLISSDSVSPHPVTTCFVYSHHPLECYAPLIFNTAPIQEIQIL